MISRKKNQWIAAHIFYDGDLNLVLIHLVQPFIRQFRDLLNVHTPYFFIRYGERGSHIRLRMNFANEIAVQRLTTELPVKAAVFFNQFPDVSTGNVAKPEAPVTCNRIEFLPYEPEFVRYGGVDVMPWAEHHFYSASAIILDWALSGKSGLIQALKLHLALLFSSGWSYDLCRQACQVFIEGWLPRLYQRGEDQVAAGQYWLSVFETTFDRQKDRLLPAMKQFIEQLEGEGAAQDIKGFVEINIGVLAAYRDAGIADNRLYSIVSSMMHMNNNRLGLPNHEEAYVVYTVMQVLSFMETK